MKLVQIEGLDLEMLFSHFFEIIAPESASRFILHVSDCFIPLDLQVMPWSKD